MNTDRAKQIGQVQEQIQRENRTRRNYPRKWLPVYEAAPWKEMYDQNKISVQIEEVLKDECPFVYSNEGDSYFVSPEMYRSLVAACRCGRPRKGLHLLKCLQNPQNKYLTNNQAKANDKDQLKDNKVENLPQTSNGFVGWSQPQLPSYKKWENSMRYISPLYDMPGERVTSTSYNAIIIG